MRFESPFWSPERLETHDNLGAEKISGILKHHNPSYRRGTQNCKNLPRDHFCEVKSGLSFEYVSFFKLFCWRVRKRRQIQISAERTDSSYLVDNCQTTVDRSRSLQSE